MVVPDMSEKERQTKRGGGKRERGRETFREVLERKPHATITTASKEKEGRASSNLDCPFPFIRTFLQLDVRKKTRLQRRKKEEDLKLSSSYLILLILIQRHLHRGAEARNGP